MTTRTVTGISDLETSTSQKYLVVNDFLARLEALAVPTARGEVITAAPATPIEGVTYLCNTAIPGINNTGAGSFIRYTKPSNSTNPALTAQVLQSTPGLSPADDYVQHAGLWKLKTDPSIYGTNVSVWPNNLVLRLPNPLVLTTTTAQLYTLQGSPPNPFPATLIAGTYMIVNGNPVTIYKIS